MEATEKERKAQHPKVAYEPRDLKERTIFSFLLVLAGSGLLIHILIWGVFRHLGRGAYVSHQTTNPIMTSNEELQPIGGDPARSFPMPRLQPDPIADLNKFRFAEEERLNSYGWIDPSTGRIHVPIERSIDILGAAWPQQQSVDQGQIKPGQAQPANQQNGNSHGGKP